MSEVSEESQQVMTNCKLQMKQPFKILIDIWGVMTSWDFQHVLNDYFRDNVMDFFERNSDKFQIKDFIIRLMEQTESDKQTNPDLPSILSPNDNNISEVIKSVVDNIKWRETNKLNSFLKDIKEFRDTVWTEGYRTHKLLVHVFDDVEPALKYWTSEDLSIKIYTFASGQPKKQKLFLSSTLAGDLNRYVMNGINSFHQYKYDVKRFQQIFCALLERDPKNILYITDSPRKARPAIEANFRSVVVLRPGNRKYTNEELKDLQIITSLDQLDFLIA